MKSVFDVFIPVGFPRYTYIDRPDLERIIQAWVSLPTKHLLIFGPSKTGKTSLWKKHLATKNVLKIGCNDQKGLEELYREILFELDAHFESEITSGNTTHATLGLSLKNFLGIGSISAKGEAGVEKTTEKVSSPISTPPLTANVVSKFLKPSGKTIVLEDFHYASDDLKRQLSQDLKVFSDDESGWVIVGVQHKTSELLSYNSDLQLRISEIPVEGFTNSQLREIFEKAKSELKISFSDQLVEKIIEESGGSASLIQAICLKLCQIFGFSKEQSEFTTIQDITKLTQACGEVAKEQKAYYLKLVQHISKGGRSDGSTEKYKWFLKLIKEVKIPDSGLKNTQVLHEIQRLGHANIEQGSVTGGLSYLPKLLTKANFPSFFDYDEGSKTFYLMDRQMPFVFRWVPELVEDLFAPQP